MPWHMVFAILCALGAHAFAPAPIRWGGLPAKNFVLVPKALASGVPVPHKGLDTPWQLTIWDQASSMSSNEIPFFLANHDSTITWDATGMCVEASGDKEGDEIRINHCSGGPNQLWSFLPWDHGRKNVIRLKGSQLCINVNAEGGWNGASVELRECNDKASGSWMFGGPVSRGRSSQPAPFFRMRHAAFGLVLLLGALSLSTWAWLWRKSAVALPIDQHRAALNVDHGGVSMLTFESGKPLIPATMAISPASPEDSEDNTTKDLQKQSSIPLYKLADLASVRTYNYELPTIVSDGRFTDRVSWQQDQTFKEHLEKRFPLFKDIPELLSGLAIYGGCVVDFLLNREHYVNDIDIAFFHGDEDSPEQRGQALAARVKEFVGACYTWQKAEVDRYHRTKNHKERKGRLYDLDEVVVIRRQNVYTIKMDPDFCRVPIQIHGTTNLESLFCEVDIDPTAVAFFDGQVVMDERAKVSLESLAFPIDSDHAHSYYDYRVRKYYNKGFDVILPKLDINSLHRRNLQFGVEEVLDMPFLRAFYTSLKGNKIMTSKLELTAVADTTAVANPLAQAQMARWLDRQRLAQRHAFGGYGAGSFDEDDEEEDNVGQLIHSNIRNLVQRNYEDFIFHGEGELYEQAFEPDILITERMLTNTYETVRKSVFGRGGLNLGVLEGYFPVKDMSRILRELLVEYSEMAYLENKDIEDRPSVLAAGRMSPSTRIGTFTSKAFKDHVDKYMDQLVAEQIFAAKKILLELKGKGSLALESGITKDRDELIVPDNGRFLYGEYYLES